jgi:hypothetical protein
MSTPQFDDPASGAGIDLQPLLGRLLLVKPHRIEVGINTSNGVRDATVADVIILDGPEAGTVHESAFIWPKVLQSNLAPTVGTGRFQLGRLAQGIAKPGQNPPWKLEAGNDADRQTAARFLSGSGPAQRQQPAPAAGGGGYGGSNSYDEPPF